MHDLTLQLAELPPREVSAGVGLVVRLNLACAAGCDLRGQSLTVLAPGGGETAIPLVSFSDATNQSGAAELNVPGVVGECEWVFLFHGDDKEHKTARLQVALTALPHELGAAVWDVPSAISAGAAFTVRVGLQCLAGCNLTGTEVGVCDHGGARLGIARLGPTAWPGTSGLHWADVGLMASASPGVVHHSLAVAAESLALPHEAPVGGFSIRVTTPPEHTVLVRVIEEATGSQLTGVEVRLGPYLVAAPFGEVSIPIAAGTYELSFRKEGYSILPIEVAVCADVTIAAVAKTGLSRAELEAELSRFDDYPWG